MGMELLYHEWTVGGLEGLEDEYILQCLAQRVFAGPSSFLQQPKTVIAG